jgi:hypothetical protein
METGLPFFNDDVYDELHDCDDAAGDDYDGRSDYDNRGAYYNLVAHYFLDNKYVDYFDRAILRVLGAGEYSGWV